MEERKDTQQRPEAVEVFTKLWIGIISAELIHQIFTIIIGVLDPAEVRRSLEQQMQSTPSPQIPESMVPVLVYSSYAIMGIISLLILSILGYSTNRVYLGTKRSRIGRSLLTFFEIYFVLRMVMIFFSQPQSNVVPIALYGIDGSIQIIIGVVCAMALHFGRKEETLRWTGEWQMIENLRNGGK